MAMEVAARLAHRLAVLPEAAMRAAVLTEALAGLDPADAVDVIAALTEGATRGREPPYLVAVSALALALERLPYPLRRDLYEAAKTAGADGIARLFLAAPPEATPPPAPEQFVPGTGRSISL